jgi:hypothetical protein
MRISNPCVAMQGPCPDPEALCGLCANLDIRKSAVKGGRPVFFCRLDEQPRRVLSPACAAYVAADLPGKELACR